MNTKTFKIGEYAIGGIIKVDIHGKVIQIKCLDYFTEEEITTGSVLSTQPNVANQISEFLNDITTCYYSDKILNWIESKVNLNKQYYY